MSQVSNYDLVVIGSGPGGHTLAEQAARLGAQVAIVEKGAWGGVCTNVGCIPSKALLIASKHYADLSKLGRMGISVSGAEFDFPIMKRHMEQAIKVAQLGVGKLLDDAGVTRVVGEAFVESPTEVRILAEGKEQRITTKRIALAWGSSPVVPPFIQLGGRILTTDSFFTLSALPKEMIILGGGVIGVELATFLAELKVQVTIVEMLPQLLPSAEPEAAALIAESLKKRSVRILTGARLTALAESDGQVHAILEHNDTQAVSADMALVAIGRRPQLRVEELDGLGVLYDRRGIQVDHELRTTVDGVYALGDLVPGAMLAHRASAQAKALARHLFGDGQFDFDEKNVPSVVYSHPGMAQIGLTEADARARFGEIEIVQHNYGANPVARASLLGQGYAKLLFAQSKLVGGTIVGEQAAELISPLCLALSGGLDRAQFESWIVPHPTLSEVVWAAGS